MIGSTISHYKITGKLGQGGMGIVYKADDTRLNRPVALKFLSRESIEEKHRLRFLNEARAAAQVRHPNICPIYDIDESDGEMFIAMAFIEGQTITNLGGGQPMPFETAVDYTMQILNGLEEAHKNGIIHRDIKSSNIVVDHQGHVYILDFGLALVEGGERLTVGAGIIGTPSYMSPEQAQGLTVDHRTDLWSTAVMLFEMLTGRTPFARGQDWAVVHAIIHDPLPPLNALRPAIAWPLQQVVETALSKDPNERWQSAGKFAAELRRTQQNTANLSNAPTMVMMPSSQLPPQSQASQSGPSRRMLISGAGLATVAAGGLGLWKSGLLEQKPIQPEGSHIAVLPFNVIGENSEVRVIADGLVESLTVKLSQLEEFQSKVFVIPASEIRSRNITSPGEARRIYGATLVIAGSAELMKDMLQFTVSLIDAKTLRLMSAANFDFNVNNLILLRDGVLKGILSLLQIKLSQAGGKVTTEGETGTPEAYSDYLKGTGYFARYDVTGNIDKALASYQSAVKKDPTYALAYAGLGDVYLRKALDSGDKAWSNLAVESAERAVKLGPNLAIAHSRLGKVYRSFGKEDEAIPELQKALTLSPGFAEAYRELADLLKNKGRFKEAESLYLEAVAKAPQDWYGQVLLGYFYREQARYKEAEDAFQKALNLTPDNAVVHRTLAALYFDLGKYKENREWLERSLKFEPTARVYSSLGIAYMYERRYQKAAEAIETSIRLDASRYSSWGNLGIVYSFLPDKKGKSKETLEHAVELAKKMLEVTPKEYRIRKNMAEYYARLENPNQASIELGMIPEDQRRIYLPDFVLVYELCGRRPKAIEYFNQLPNEAAVRGVKNDPSLEQFWQDPSVQKIVSAKWRSLR